MIADCRKSLRAALAAALLAWTALPSLALPDPGQAGPVVGQMVARLLEQNHYNRRLLDGETSKELIANYLEAFDYNRMFFQKPDIDEFNSRYGDALAQRIKEGDIQPALEIFERFLKRLEEREALVKKLARSTFTFEAEEAFPVDRHEAPWPSGPEEAAELWRLRIKNELLQERLNKTKPEEQVKNVTLRYERLRRMYREYDGSDVLQAYLTALAHTFDPHSEYMAAPQMENFNISMRLSLVGIGAVLRSEDGYAKIVSLVPGGPADQDKRLKPNDRIEAVAQGDSPFMETVGMKLDRVVQLIRGEKGTLVRLRVIPADALDPATRVVIALVRDEIKLTDQEAKAKILELEGPGGKTLKIGAIDLPSFYADMKSMVEPKSTTRDLEKLISYLKKERVDGLILDLRRNGGGSLPESVALTGLFIPEGPVVQVKDARGLIRMLRDTDSEVLYSGPLLVLTNHASASASEILAAALQDYGRAVIVGEKSTFGKGTVQSLIELAQYLPAALKSYKPGAVKLTIQKFYRISGGSTQNRGAVPDIQLPSVMDFMDATESSLKHALPYDEVEPARYQRLELITPERIKALQKASGERVSASPEFAYVREDIELYKRQKDEKAVTLNEKKRLEEKQEEEARSIKRKKERAARRAKPLTATEITLAVTEGLKPPIKSTAPVTVPVEAASEEKEGDYEKAPTTPDIVLEESAHILADLIALQAQPEQAVGLTPETYTR